MICYRPFELHNHTKHSDGQFTVPELMHAAKDYGYVGIALTDHNTVTAIHDVTPALEAETVKVIDGIEWTTFFGHMVVLGCDHYVDWRFVTPDTIDDALVEIRAAGGAAGVAHPCEVGSPLMCGCNWEFNVTRWDLVDYIEIWSADDPMSRSKNQLVMPWYDKLLNEGHHLAISAGRDWHAPDHEPHLLTATYLGLSDGAVMQQTALEALHAGRTYVTLGPTINLSLEQGSAVCGLGETARSGKGILHVTVGQTERRALWEIWDIKVKTIRLIINGETAAELPYTGETAAFDRVFPAGWLRIELRGSHKRGTGDEELIAMTSPIYVE